MLYKSEMKYNNYTKLKKWLFTFKGTWDNKIIASVCITKELIYKIKSLNIEASAN